MPFAKPSFPPDAMATIYGPARSAMTSGTANTRLWKLRFEPRTAPFLEPLMGWTGGTETLSQVELDFPSAEAAVGYAKRQGLNFVVQGPAEATQDRCPTADKSKVGDPDRTAAPADSLRPCTRKLEWVERTREARAMNGGFDLDRVLASPAAAFGESEQVVRQSKLSDEQKREILRRWALEAYRTSRLRGHPRLGRAVRAPCTSSGSTVNTSDRQRPELGMVMRRDLQRRRSNDGAEMEGIGC